MSEFRDVVAGHHYLILVSDSGDAKQFSNVIMNRVAITLLVSLAAAFGPVASFACTCVESPPLERFEQATSVLCGRVIHKEKFMIPFERDGQLIGYVDNYRYTIAAYAWWKGESTDTVLVRTDQGTACGVSLPSDTDVLVYTYTREGEEWTGACQGDGPVATAFLDRYYLGPPAWRQQGYALRHVSLEDIFAASESDDDRVRVSAAYALGRIIESRDEILPRLMEMLSSDVPARQQCALLALRQMGQSAQDLVPAVATMLDSPVSAVREETHLTLWRLSGSCQYFLYGIRGLLDDADEVRTTAALGLANTGSCITDEQIASLKEAIEQTMDSSSDTTRGYLIYLLDECGCIAADWIPILEAWQQSDRSDWVRYCARVTLSKLRERCP